MGAIAAPLTLLAVDLRAMAPRSTARAAGGPSACDRLPSPGSHRRGPLGRVAELADAQDSGSCVRKDVGVQVPPRPPPPRTPIDCERTRGEDTMTTSSHNASSNLPGKPPVVDMATWQAARDELLVREKAHTREGDAIAAARRRLPMVELDGAVEVTGVDGPVPFLDLFQGRDELVVYQHMWYD